MKTAAQTPEISKHEKIIFGMADFFGGGAQALITGIYTVFLTMNGVSIALAGVIVAIAKAWDAINDPLIGVISDNTRSKWGRRRPYIFIGGILVVLSFGLLFFPMYSINTSAIKFAYYLFSYLVYSTVASIILVPYYSLSTEIATTYHETTQINTIRLYFSMASSAVSAVIPLYLVDRLHDNTLSVNTFSLLMVFVFGVIYCIPLLLCGIFCKERAALPDERTKFSLKSFLIPFSVKSFRYLLMIYLCAFTCMDIISVNVVYFAEYGIDVSVSSSVMLGAIVIGYVGMIPVLSHLIKQGKSKPDLIRLGIPLYIFCTITLTLLPQGADTFIVLVLCVTIGIGMSGCQMIPWIMFPDVVDIAELKLSTRASGSFSGIMTFSRKATSAIAIALTGLVLQLTGFVEPVADADGIIPDIEQSVSAQWGLRMIILVSISILISIVFIFAKKLRLSQTRSRQVKMLLKKRQSGQPYDQQDTIMLHEISKELF